MKTMLLILGFLMTGLSPVSPAVAQEPPSSARTTNPVAVELVERQSQCPTVIVYQGGKADNFAPGIDPVHPSLALDALLQGHLPGHNPVAYDDATDCDHWFGDSFKLDACVFCCGICSATLEITLRGCGSGLDCNDTITVGQAPFSGAGGYVLWSGLIDPNGCPGGGTPGDLELPDIELKSSDRPRASGPTIVKTIVLDPRKVADLICERKITYLDVFVQDDRIVDSMRLIITKP